MNKKLFDIPVLLIAFNRPETTCHVFEQIRKLKPESLYIFSDAPREDQPDEADLVDTCRCLVDDTQINWDCKVERWYPESNMGYAIGVSSAISWAFETTEKLIILQDDCLPHPTFFKFCKFMLDKYDTNDRVMHVSGTRWNEEPDLAHTDHFFSLIGHVWGWATWKRAWSKYDFWMEQLPEMKHQKRLQKLFGNADMAKYWYDRFDQVYEELRKHTWDCQWQYTLFKNYGLAAIPNVNLVSNIGFEGTDSAVRQTEHHFRETKEWQAIGGNVPLSIDARYERSCTSRLLLLRLRLRARIVNRFKQMLA